MNEKSNLLEQIAFKMAQISRNTPKGKADLDTVFMLFSLFFERFTESNTIGFTTLFSRIAFFGVQHNISGYLVYETQQFRKMLEKGAAKTEDIEDLIALGLHLIQANAEAVNNFKWPTRYEKTEKVFNVKKSTALGFTRVAKAILFKIDQSMVEVILEEVPEVKQQIEITDPEFSRQLRQIAKHMVLPLSINLIDLTFYPDKQTAAKAFVLLPDFLLGVTSVSECFSHTGATSLKYFGRKLIPSDSSVHMLIGNVVNHYLDELIHDPELEFKEVLQDTFQLAPEMFSMMSDQEIKDCIAKVNVHFNNLKSVVKDELAEAGITKERSYLEPSFYSNEYGLQGRLDLYHYNERTAQSQIVELKSGKLYQAHKYGLNQNHYVQTLLYDLILESVYNGKVKSTNYILYSANDTKRLRFAPKVRSKQLDALRLRNSLMIVEDLLTKLDDENSADILQKLNPEEIPEAYTFLRRDAKKFWDAYGRLSLLEQAYYKVFIAFISREFRLSKIGKHGIHASNGLASLWLDPMIEKTDMFTILTFLEVIENNTELKIPTITLGFTEQSNRLSKFRVGDITVLYPYDNEATSVLSNQLFKCTVLELSGETVTLRLRARQKNYEIFRKYKYWNIEADVLDSGFSKQYHGMFGFMIADKKFRDKILCLTPPDRPKSLVEYINPKMTEEQVALTVNAISAIDYFLLWGPPGTGKTSVMISSLVEYYYEKTDQELLILAYTNRAVDEICSAIHAKLEGNYLRIGSRYSTAEKYRSNLLTTKTDKVATRSELLAIFKSHRITVSTISSFQGKREMNVLKKYDLVIIDEASQLLEPMLVGMLSQLNKFILIGDHKQLPAVVTQDEERSKIYHKELIAQSGLSDTRISLFERMYKQCIQNSWYWAFGGLTNQGRMHLDLVGFVSNEFYEGKLNILCGIARLTEKPELKFKSSLQEALIVNRMIFIDTPKGQNVTRKTNLFEAELVTSLVTEWSKIYKLNGLMITEYSIGVITPFRSQIAMIKNQGTLPMDMPLTIDTIERYQGGARDRIIISLAVNEIELLESISNISEEGIDRKLNVALTRAKEHLIVVGNKEILLRKGLYSRLIEHSYELDIRKVIEQ